jgi:phosphatidylglycerophosphate synthase
MLGWKIYLATRKKNDQLFNHYFMRVLAGFTVAALAKTPITPNQVTLLNLALFIVSAGLFIALPTYAGGLIAVAVLELSYLFDCCDGMLARHKKIASKEGHLFDFFTDEIKAVLLIACLGVRAAIAGGYGPPLSASPWPIPWSREQFLFATIAGVIVIASATSLTNFVRRPELSGRETTVEAFYETVDASGPRSLVARVAGLAFTFLRFLNHYPSHIYLFALFGRLDLFFWMYFAINGLYLARGWLGLVVRFGRPSR